MGRCCRKPAAPSGERAAGVTRSTGYAMLIADLRGSGSCRGLVWGQLGPIKTTIEANVFQLAIPCLGAL